MKKSFILYTDMYEAFEYLPDNIAGQVIKLIFNYVIGNEMPDVEHEAGIAFKFIKPHLDRDLENWEKEKKARTESGRKGGLARARNAKESLGVLSKAKETQANQAVNVNANVNDKNILTNVNSDESPKKTFGNEKVNTVIAKFKEYTSRLPVDSNSRQEAHAISQRIDSFNKARGKETDMVNFKKVLDSLFTKLSEKDYFDKIEKLKPIRLRAIAIFDQHLTTINNSKEKK